MSVPYIRALKFTQAIFAGVFIAACQNTTTEATSSGGKSLFDQPLSAAFYPDGEDNFAIENGELVSLTTNARRFKLRSLKTYDDFELSVDFLVDAQTNSGVYIRCADPNSVTPVTCYEVNIFEANPDQNSRTGAIMRIEPQMREVPTAGQWSKLNIHANGDHLVVKINGIITVDIHDETHSAGIFAIQHAEGGHPLKMRNLTIKDL